MAKFEDVLAPGITIRESANDGSDFTNPTADYRRLFLGEDGLLHLKDSSGTVTDIGGGSGAVATDAIWDAKGDLAGGTGANTAVKLTVGTNGYVLTADSGETTGMKWAPSGASLTYAEFLLASDQTGLAGDTPTDITSCTISLATGTWLIGGQVTGNGTYVQAWTASGSSGTGTPLAASIVMVPNTRGTAVVSPRAVVLGSTTSYHLRTQQGGGSKTAYALEGGAGVAPGTFIWAVKIA